jgi:hypothetical protein
LQPGSQREAQAAKELLLTRLMSVHPEVYGGGRVRLHPEGGYFIEIELSQPLPRHVKLSDDFMGYLVVYRVTGWKPDLMPYQEPPGETLPNA